MCRAYSLLETTIALALLGFGLIMVGSVFPVALTQHRESVEQAGASQLLSKARATIQSRFTASALAGDPNASNPPWYVLPHANIQANLPSGIVGQWVADPAYWNAINFNGAAANPSHMLVGPYDQLSDIQPPADDAQANRAAYRLVWYGFYRKDSELGGATFAYAVCRQRQGQLFARQAANAVAGLSSTRLIADADASASWRLPEPWRVTVSVVGNNVLANDTSIDPVPLASLAPIGSKLMIAGNAYYHDPTQGPPAGCTPPHLPAGRILTVIDVGPVAVQVREDLSDLQLNCTPPTDFYMFDVWLFPPSFVGGAAGWDRTSPVVEWNAS